VDLVIVGGGDGSMNAVADALVETGLPLGILPLGTANDLARTLQIPPDVETACRIITEGHVRKIDLGWVNGKHFFNVASMGLSVRICRQLDANAKKRWGVFAYLITTIKVLWQMRPFRAVIRSGNAQWSVRSVQITVGNGRFFGGGMAVSEDATIDDQRLDLYSIEVDRVWQMLGLFWALRRGQLAHVPQVRTLQGQEFEVRTRRPRWINTDGELTVRTPATFRTIPLAVTVVAPAPSPTA
jgi:diacylglycerol kinase (ATP)